MMKTAVLYCSPTCHNCIEMEENMSAAGMHWIHADITKIHWRTEAGKAHVQSFPTLVFYGTKENGKIFPISTHIGLLPVHVIKEIYNPTEDYYLQEPPKGTPGDLLGIICPKEASSPAPLTKETGANTKPTPGAK